MDQSIVVSSIYISIYCNRIIKETKNGMKNVTKRGEEKVRKKRKNKETKKCERKEKKKIVLSNSRETRK